LWCRSPEDVSPDWRLFFQGFELGQEVFLPGKETPPSVDQLLKNSAVQSLIYRYRHLGHLLACTDPLNPCPTDHPLLSLAAFDLDQRDLDRVYHTRRFMKESATLREILSIMRETYCRSIGVEFMHIQEPAERDWLKDRMEPVRNRPELTPAEKREILRKLLEAFLFETFLHRRFVGQKRFSLEGGETVIPLLDHLVRRAVHMGIRDIVLGMPHRGRLNILANLFGKPLADIFSEFEDNIEFGFVWEGDVKYHKGFSAVPKSPSCANESLSDRPPAVVVACRIHVPCLTYT
jgi:2-oxoglutarate dehydrogenase E1 component